ncbi:MAG: hypothetical protein QOF53_1388, partial [Nocardioidaceae bacterium]|nr:hypothetical protein [Nocardioidaceae bacterium]
MTKSFGARPPSPTKNPRRSRRRGAAAVASVALLLGGISAASAATQVTEKNPNGLIGVGPVSGDTGFPAWYEDANHTRVELCLDDTNPMCGFLPGDIPDPDNPISFPDNFPSEAFYALASSQLTSGAFKATLTLGLEAAFVNAVQPGDQQVFGRQRIVVKSGPPNSTLTFKEPYGTITVDTDSTGAGRLVEDISPAVGNFTTPLKGNVGPFLQWDTGAPAGYLGDPAILHAVTGSPLRNDFSVTGGGLNVTTNLFNVQGKISTNSGVSADAAVVNASGTMLDVFATSSSGAQLQVEGTGLPTTPMVTDPSSGRFYARVPLSGPAPASVKVVNLADKPASSGVVNVTQPSGITITQASYDGSTLTVAAKSANGYPVHVVGIGDLTDSNPTTFNVAAPGGSVTVKNDIGSASLPVTITGGAAMPAAQPPTPVSPDPGPVVVTDPGTGTPPPPAVTKAVATIADSSLSRGLSTTLDGSGSTNGGTGALTYEWSQTGGPAVTISDTKAAKPTVNVPFFTKTANASPVAADKANPAVLHLKVTDSAGNTSATDVNLNVVDDSVVIAAGARHRIGTELRVTGTATLPGNTATLVPQTQVVVYDVTPGHAVTKLGSAPVDTLNAFDLRLK